MAHSEDSICFEFSNGETYTRSELEKLAAKDQLRDELTRTGGTGKAISAFLPRASPSTDEMPTEKALEVAHIIKGSLNDRERQLLASALARNATPDKALKSWRD